jgi:hypothetical protein
VGWTRSRRRARSRLGQRRASRPWRLERGASQRDVDDSRRHCRRAQARAAQATHASGVLDRDRGCRVMRCKP